MLMRLPFHTSDVTLARIVMPRSRSKSLESMALSATRWLSRKEPDWRWRRGGWGWPAVIGVAGYPRLVEADERGTLAELATIRLKVMRPTLATYNGNLFKTMGDGALIEFNSVEDGVRWGLEFQMA